MRERRMGRPRPDKVDYLQDRLDQQDKKVKILESRPGPEKKKGEKVGEYKDRIKRHEFVQERQLRLAPVHRELIARRLKKRYGSE